MLVTWRRWLSASTAIVLTGSIACSSSSSATSEPSPTLVTVAPSTFGQGLVCGNFSGAWKTYVATLTDDAYPNQPLASSGPVPCTMPVSFAWVIPDHKYTAKIEAYDRDDLHPVLGTPGNPQMVDPNEQPVEPRWTAECGGPTIARLQSDVVVQGCTQLTGLPPSGDTAILLDLATVRGNLSCGAEVDQVDHLRVIPEDPSLDPVDVACDGTHTFPSLDKDTTYRFRVEAYEAASSSARWATNCQGQTREGITLPAACDPLSERGALRIDIDALAAAAERTCSEDDVVSYRAVLVGSSLGGSLSSCKLDAAFNALERSDYQAVVEAFDSAGEEAFNAICDGTVQPATTTTMVCQVSPK